MSRSRRLVDIVRALKTAAPGALTAEALAARFDVSDRTIYRDMAALMETGLPIEGEAGLGYVLSVEGGPPPVSLTWAEAESLWRATRMLTPAARSEPAAAAILKLEAALGPVRLARLAADTHPSVADSLVQPALLDALAAATAAGRGLRVAHADESGRIQISEGRATALSGAGAATSLRLETAGGPVDLPAARIVRLTVRAG